MHAKHLLFTASLFALVSIVAAPGVIHADPCLVVYPTSPAEYHYDVNEYYTVTFGHPLYDETYDRGGEVLIDLNSNDIAFNIYQTPNVTGFLPSVSRGEP